jgi:transposase-like protein
MYFVGWAKPKGREDMVRTVVDGGASLAAAARQFNTKPKTVRKFVGRAKRPKRSGGRVPTNVCLTRETVVGRRWSAHTEPLPFLIAKASGTVARVSIATTITAREMPIRSPTRPLSGGDTAAAPMVSV